MPNMKTNINHNLLTQKIEKRNNMQYYEQTVRLIAILIEYLRNNTTEKGASFPQRYFLHKGLKSLDEKGVKR